MKRISRFDIRQTGPRILWAFAALAAANLVFFLIWVQPVVREHRNLDDVHSPVFDELAKRQKQVEHHEAFLQAVLKAEADLQNLRKDTLSTRDLRLVEVQEEVARLCDEFGVNWDSVGYGNELLLDEELDRLAIDVPLEGNYASLRKFLHAVESSDKFLLVERVALAKGKEGGVLLSLKINLATYFNAPEELVERKRTMERRSRRRRS